MLKVGKAFFYGWAATATLAMATRFECRELVTPRLFGGVYKPSEFSTVAMDANGNMLAGGWTQDEDTFIPTVREDIDNTQITVPILAYYPHEGPAAHSEAKIFQIYIWISSSGTLPVAINGQVKAVSITVDLQDSEESTKPKYAALLEQKDIEDENSTTQATENILYALLLKKDTFEVMANYEISAGKIDIIDKPLTGNNRSIYYRAEDDMLFVVLEAPSPESINQFKILMIKQPITVGNTNIQSCKSLPTILINLTASF